MAAPIPPAAHLAIHDRGALKVCQEILHLIEGLPILMHHAIISRHKRPQGVSHQLFQAALLTLTETFQNPTVLTGLEVPCVKQDQEETVSDRDLPPLLPGRYHTSHCHLVGHPSNAVSPSLSAVFVCSETDGLELKDPAYLCLPPSAGTKGSLARPAHTWLSLDGFISTLRCLYRILFTAYTIIYFVILENIYFYFYMNGCVRVFTEARKRHPIPQNWSYK